MSSPALAAPAPPSASSASFTGPNSVRYPAPDIARGLMLILIAVANVPMWLAMFPDRPDQTIADQWWVLIRGLLIDHRVYPLFAVLFGFGLMTMVIRRHDAHVASRTAELDAKAPGLPAEARAQWLAGFDKEATDDGRRLVRRRGYWMLLFGFVHGIVFFGDIIGAYALVAILFAGLVARRRFKVMAAIGVVQTVLMVVSLYFQQVQVEAMGGIGGHSFGFMLHWYYPFVSALQWALGSVMTALLSAVIPCTFIGAWLATTDIVSRPDRHRGLLVGLAVGGLALTAAMGAPHALYTAGFRSDWMTGSFSMHETSGIFGAIGWLSLLALAAGPARGALTGWRRVASSVGKRSMTAYIGQTVLFVPTFLVIGLSGVRGVSEIVGLVIALVVWALLAAFCFALESKGYKRGPLEVLLRRAVAKTAGEHPIPVVPCVPALEVSAVEGAAGAHGSESAGAQTGEGEQTMPAVSAPTPADPQAPISPRDPQKPPNV